MVKPQYINKDGHKFKYASTADTRKEMEKFIKKNNANKYPVFPENDYKFLYRIIPAKTISGRKVVRAYITYLKK